MDTAVVIISDKGFLVPSLMLALQVGTDPRYQRECHVLLFLIDVDPDLVREVQARFASSCLRVAPLSSADLDLPVGSSNFAGHVPVACMARLSIPDFVPGTYRNIIYLDGDIRIAGDISPLLTLRLAQGEVAACAENFILLEDEQGRRPAWLDAVLAAVGLRRAADYLNSGVLAFRADTWASVSAQARSFYRENEGLCRHHDQSAVNAVLNGSWVRLPLGYNFQSFFEPVATSGQVPRRMLHFSSSPKPWSSPDSWWDPTLSEPYREFVAHHPRVSEDFRVYDAALMPTGLALATRRLKGHARRAWSGAKRSANLARYLRTESFRLG